jgi:hypothetical protein
MKTFTTFFFAALLSCLHAQQLYLEAFSGFNFTRYDLETYGNSDIYYPLGFRLAGGADHFQIGGEYHRQLSNPSFEVNDPSTGKDEFTETYYGAFGRVKICRYPAMRFGLVFRAGAGLYDMGKIFTSGGTTQTIEYDPQLGANAGFGFSMPLIKSLMLELSYNYHLIQRPELKEHNLPKYRASYHAIQAGLSLNFVFGERAEKYRQLRDNSRWKEGWRG